MTTSLCSRAADSAEVHHQQWTSLILTVTFWKCVGDRLHVPVSTSQGQPRNHKFWVNMSEQLRDCSLFPKDPWWFDPYPWYTSAFMGGSKVRTITPATISAGLYSWKVALKVTFHAVDEISGARVCVKAELPWWTSPTVNIKTCHVAFFRSILYWLP